MRKPTHLHAMLPAEVFSAWPISARPESARLGRRFLTLQHRRPTIPAVRLAVEGSQLVWEKGKNPTKEESAFARAAVHFSAGWPAEMWEHIHAIVGVIAREPDLMSSLRARVESGVATSVERTILAASLPDGPEFVECARSIRAEELPRVGCAYPLVLTRLGFGSEARDWLASTPSHFRLGASAIFAMLRVDEKEFPQPRPLARNEQVAWAQGLYGGPGTRTALATIRLALKELEPETVHELFETCAPHALLLAPAASEPLAELLRSRHFLWLGDAEQALANLVDDGSLQSAATRIGALCLLGKHREVLELHKEASARWPESQELALWRLEALVMLERRDDAEEKGEEDQHLIGTHPIGRLLRALNRLDSLGPSEGRSSTRYFHRALIRQLIPDASLEKVKPKHELDLIRQALARFGGSRTADPTVVDGDALVRPGLLEPRAEIIRIQHQLLTRPIPEVKEALRTYNAGYPDVPFGPTYSAELDLFTGDYQDALDVFLESWRTTGTRWSYVGAGAAYVLLGRHAEALEMFDKGEFDAGELIPGEATHAYRGEALLKLGRPEEGLPHLEYAYEVEPRRLGATLVLSFLYRALSRDEDADRLLADFAARAPILVAEAKAMVGEDWADKALEMLHGNRSSHLLTFRDRNQRWRVIDIGHGEAAMASLERSLSLESFADELWYVLPELAE